MNREEFELIFEDEDIVVNWDGCNIIEGCLIMRKYLPDAGIGAVGHGIVYSSDIDELIKAGITKEDVEKIRSLNWMIDDSCLSCFA